MISGGNLEWMLTEMNVGDKIAFLQDSTIMLLVVLNVARSETYTHRQFFQTGGTVGPLYMSVHHIEMSYLRKNR